jgi:hypothetical protein
MVGVPLNGEEPLPDERGSLEPVGNVSPSRTPMSFFLSFPLFLDCLEGCWPMKRPRVDEEVDGPGDCALDFESLLVKTEKRELASL